MGGLIIGPDTGDLAYENATWLRLAPGFLPGNPTVAGLIIRPDQINPRQSLEQHGFTSYAGLIDNSPTGLLPLAEHVGFDISHDFEIDAYEQLGEPETLTKIGGGVFPDTHSQNWIDGAVTVQALATFIGEPLDYYYADTATPPTELLRRFDVATVRLIPRRYGDVASYRRPDARPSDFRRDCTDNRQQP